MFFYVQYRTRRIYIDRNDATAMALIALILVSSTQLTSSVSSGIRVYTDCNHGLAGDAVFDARCCCIGVSSCVERRSLW